MNKDIVSIVVPMYNSAQFIIRTLECICNQTYKNIEILCVDDCSIDNTCSIVEEFMKLDNRIKLIRKPVNTGAVLSMEIAYRQSTGKYIVFVDHDDEIENDMIELMYNKTLEKDYDIVCCNIKYLDSKRRECLGDFPSNLADGSPELLKKMIEVLIITKKEDHISLNGMFGWWSKLYKKSVLKNVDFQKYSERKVSAGDFLFNLTAMLDATTVAYIPNLYYHYNYISDSMSKQYKHRTFDTRYLSIEIAKLLITNSNCSYKEDYLDRLNYRMWMTYAYTSSNEFLRNPHGKYSAIKVINKNMLKPILIDSVKYIKLTNTSSKKGYKLFMICLYLYTKIRLLCLKQL